MANKTIYVPDESVWLEFVREAEREGISVSALLVKALHAYLKPSSAREKLNKIARILND